MAAELPPELADEHIRPNDLAELLHVRPKTVSRWAKDGKLPYSRTLGGHRRFALADIWPLVVQLSASDQLPDPATWLADRRAGRRHHKTRPQ